MTTTPENQRERIALAARLLGGNRATARALGCSERFLRALISGEKAASPGMLADLGKALLAHAELCRQTEFQISPAFTRNLTDRQRELQEKNDQRGRNARGPKVRVKDPASLCQSCGRNPAEGHRSGCPNEAEPWPVIEAELGEPIVLSHLNFRNLKTEGNTFVDLVDRDAFPALDADQHPEADDGD